MTGKNGDSLQKECDALRAQLESERALALHTHKREEEIIVSLRLQLQRTMTERDALADGQDLERDTAEAFPSGRERRRMLSMMLVAGGVVALFGILVLAFTAGRG